MNAKQKASRIKKIRRWALKRVGLPIYKPRAPVERTEPNEETDLDTPNPDLIGFSEEL